MVDLLLCDLAAHGQRPGPLETAEGHTAVSSVALPPPPPSSVHTPQYCCGSVLSPQWLPLPSLSSPVSSLIRDGLHSFLQAANNKAVFTDSVHVSQRAACLYCMFACSTHCSSRKGFREIVTNSLLPEQCGVDYKCIIYDMVLTLHLKRESRVYATCRSAYTGDSAQHCFTFLIAA